MLSVIVTILSLSIMLLIIASLLISAWHTHQRRIRASETHLPSHSLDPHVTMILHMQNGVVVDAEKPTPQASFTLLRPEGIEHTAAQFGFKTTWGNSWTLDQVIDTANSGKPVIVSFPPDRYDGGHLLVVTGGDANNVYLADSSLWNRRSLTRDQFLQWWQGLAAVATPR